MKKMIGESEEPSSRSLLQSIKCIAKETNMIEIRNNKTLRLFHIDCCIKRSVDENIRDIKLMYIPITVNCNGKKNLDSRHLSYRTESIFIIDVVFLLASLCN